MPAVKKIVIKNFKSINDLTLEFDSRKNVLIGDNETGKSSVLLALDLALSASRSRVEKIGYEALLNQNAVQNFLAGPAEQDLLPKVIVEVFLEEGDDPGFYGTQNEQGIQTDGLRMEIVPLIEDFGPTIASLLISNKDSFPFEYYTVKFSTFSGAPHLSYRRPVRHLMIDNSRIDSEYAVREYTQAVFGFHTDVTDRYHLENCYRQGKEAFNIEHLTNLNDQIRGYQFALRTSSRANLGTDLVILKDGIPIVDRGKGEQCFIKTNFVLNKYEKKRSLDALLLEEPENHLSHTNMKRLVNRLADATSTQLFITTHSSHICARLDLRHAFLLGVGHAGCLKDLSEPTANFFMKAPDNNVLELALSERVILVEGDAEFILMEHFYKQKTNCFPHEENVHIISIGGTSFKRYLELGKLLNIKIAAIRDNDGNYQQNCEANFTGYLYESGKIFADPVSERSTFEICLYNDNKKACDDLFSSSRKTLSVQDYMLKNKADVAFELLTNKADELIVPQYIQEAIEWIRE